MVKVKSYALREGENGQFVSLELEGDLEMVQSLKTGRFYATTRRCFISSTFDEQTAKEMVGRKIPGEIVRTQCDPYDYTIEETGEVISLTHRYDYRPVTVSRAEHMEYEVV